MVLGEARTAGSLENTPASVTRLPVVQELRCANGDAVAYGVVLNAQGKIAWGRAGIGGNSIVVVLTEKVSGGRHAGRDADKVSYGFAGKKALDLRLALDIFKAELGVERLILEDGGVTNGVFLRAGPIGEISLIPCPRSMARQARQRLRFGINRHPGRARRSQATAQSRALRTTASCSGIGSVEGEVKR